MSEATVTSIYLEGFAGSVAANVRAETARRGWRQSDLARALGVTPKTVSRKWNGAREWGLAELDDVAKALNVSVESLVREYTTRDSNPEPADYSDQLVADSDSAVRAPVYSLAAAAMARACGEDARRFEVAS